ncbi:hypothetical protein ACSBR1_008190 [Camellia fascicularis]
MENGEAMLFIDLSNQQLPEVDAIDTGNNVVSNTEENNIVITSVQQNCIINSSQRLQRKARIPISLDDLQQHFGMKLKEATESLGENIISPGGHLAREASQPPISDPPHMQDMTIASYTKPHFTAAQDTSIVTIKGKYGDDFITFQLTVSSGMVEFQQQMAKRLNLQGGTYRVRGLAKLHLQFNITREEYNHNVDSAYY